MTVLDTILVGTYGLAASLLGVFALHRVALVWTHWRLPKCDPEAHYEGPKPTPLGQCRVLVQLPVFNEGAVVSRLLRAVALIDWPKDRLQIQLLDDSTDETTQIASEVIAELRQGGAEISHIRRDSRRGFKAGALAFGLERSTADFVAIFDADFVPTRDFLQKSIPHFEDPDIGCVQGRWEHLNREYSTLTQVQALLLDGHFEIEHQVRNRRGCFFNFNGTAGVWRRQCIDDAGGWQHDTLTEDLDLSFRAQLKGWRFRYLNHLRVPAELPIEMKALMSQQHRWAKGGVQCARKLLRLTWRTKLPWKTRMEATFHLLDHFASPLVLIMTGVLAPALLFRREHLPADVVTIIARGLLGFGLLFLFAFYITTAMQRRSWARRLRALLTIPLIVPLFAGLGLTITRATLEGAFGKDVTFVRTPKHHAVGKELGVSAQKTSAHSPRQWWKRSGEMALGFGFAWLVLVAGHAGWTVMACFSGLFCLGYLWVGGTRGEV